MLKKISLFVFLFALWLLMSGIYDNPLILAMGVFSCGLTVWIVDRLEFNVAEQDKISFHIHRLARYLFWLVVEIGKADWAVTKVILSKELPKDQSLIHVSANQQSDVMRMVFANSITITPGTVTVEAFDQTLLVHALTPEAADKTALNEMGARVCRIEKQNNANGVS
ncbi:MAG: Na+/H+ antiporter subunit E [Pseudomonadota bacterium]